MYIRRENLLMGVLIVALALGFVLPSRPGILSTRGPAVEAEPTPAYRFVTVRGDAEVRVVPDEVILTLGVETWDKDLQLAMWENDARISQVLETIEAHGVERRHIQTEHISIEPRYDDYGHQQFLGYFVRKTVVVTLKDIERFDDLLSGVLEAGANHVHGIQFRTTELRKHRDDARALAINAAREKAEALADELGQEVGEPYSINEEYNGWWSGYGGWWGSRWGGNMAQNVIVNAGNGSNDMEGTMAPGQITVSARVQVRFALK